MLDGRVALDGEPIDSGTISFLPADGKGPSAAGLITDGQYSIEASPGPKRVEIEGFKKVGQERYNPNDPSSPMVDINEPIVPEKYNVNSGLSVDVERSQNSLDFELSSR